MRDIISCNLRVLFLVRSIRGGTSVCLSSSVWRLGYLHNVQQFSVLHTLYHTLIHTSVLFCFITHNIVFRHVQCRQLYSTLELSPYERPIIKKAIKESSKALIRIWHLSNVSCRCTVKQHCWLSTCWSWENVF